ncbi:MAG: glycosyltransferase family 4 protein, partial [Dehalococcoidales bacterium]|nr:glycosyltransferase family 4 protein [Dehalococcoidales bacterium]
HTHTSIVCLARALLTRKLRNKLIYTSHATRRTRDPLIPPKLMDKVALGIADQAILRARAIVTLNAEVRNKIIGSAKIKPEKVSTLPVIVDSNRFSPSVETEETKKQYGLKGKFIVLFVGRIRPDKGVEYLVKAAKMVIDQTKNKNVQFLLVGPTDEFGSHDNTQSPYLDMVKLLITSNELQNYVRLTGSVPVEDLRKLYAACDIFVLPSITEAMPVAVLEAMASGKPIIASRVGGVPMQVKAGENGILIRPGDDKELASALDYMISHPEDRLRMGRRSREIAINEFNADTVADKLVEVYKGV